MDVVLAYDVVSDKRRARFFKSLKKFMVPVQRSVFEGALTPKTLAQVESLVYRELDMQEDSVRMYSLCRPCAGLLRCYGVAMPRTPEGTAIIV